MIVINHSLELPIGYTVEEYKTELLMSLSAYVDAVLTPYIDVKSIQEPMEMSKLDGLAEILTEKAQNGELSHINDIELREDIIIIK